ncbi:FxsA family protein [Nitratifractor sp.]
MIYLLLFFFAELFVSLKVGIVIGFGWSVVWIVGTMLLGGLLLRFSPYALMQTFQYFDFGRLGLRDVHNAAMAYLAGAILLIVPGVLSDLIGAALLLYALYLHLLATMGPKTPKDHHFQGEDDVIDVEIVDGSDRDEPPRRGG